MANIPQKNLSRAGILLACLALTILFVSLLIPLSVPADKALFALFPIYFATFPSIALAALLVWKSNFSATALTSSSGKKLLHRGAALSGVFLLVGCVITWQNGFSFLAIFLSTLLGIQNPLSCLITANYLEKSAL